jgi:hypothetical protein
MFLRVLLGFGLGLYNLAGAIPNMTEPPKAGKVELFPEGALKPGMQAVAWTVFQGSMPEPVPVEIVGIWEDGGQGDPHECCRRHEWKPRLY